MNCTLGCILIPLLPRPEVVHRTSTLKSLQTLDIDSVPAGLIRTILIGIVFLGFVLKDVWACTGD